MTRKSYNTLHAEYLAQLRAKNPALAALWGWDEFDETCLRLLGKVPNPASTAEIYAAEASLEHKPCLKGRGED